MTYFRPFDGKNCCYSQQHSPVSTVLFAVIVVGVFALFHQEAQVGFASFSIDPKPRLRQVETADVSRRVLPVQPDLAALEAGPFDELGIPQIGSIDDAELLDERYVLERDGYSVQLTLEPDMQEHAAELLKKFSVPWGALVALEVKTGRVVAIADYSDQKSEAGSVATRAGFPAASLFKLITAAAAIEQKGMDVNQVIRFRGGSYSLNRRNYLPDRRRDTRTISLGSALGKSCNPAFARIALQWLSPAVLEDYAQSFGFNASIPFELPVDDSTFDMDADDFDVARTAAGFGDAYLSPVHAALLVGAIANQGRMMKPYLVERVEHPDNGLIYIGKEQILRDVLLPSTAEKLLDAMNSTVVSGTARRQFRRFRRAVKEPMEIAAKTGTLSGKNPKGRYHWFVAAAPADNPEIALASLVIDPGYARINGTGLARLFMQRYFKNRSNS